MKIWLLSATIINSLTINLTSDTLKADGAMTDSLIPIYRYQENSDQTAYNAIHRIMRSNDQISYLSIKPIVRSIKRRFDLVEGAGKKGYLFEAVVDQRFPILRGRDGSSHFIKRGAIDFYFGYDLRMTEDQSRPLLPSNQRFGFEFRQSIWDSYTSKRVDKKVADPRNWYNTNENLNVLYATALLSHYSNGQSPGFYTNPITRQHDYIGGDFSTNFLKLMVYSTKYAAKTKNIFTYGLGFQKDFGIEGALAFSEEQEKSYGKFRLKSSFQWRSSPFKVWSFEGRKTQGYNLKELIDVRIRIEPDYILGDLSKYYTSEFGKDFRFSNHSYLEINPLRQRSLGFLIHHYYGRDYFNIRYDDVISIYHFGLTFNFLKYHPLRFNSSEAINN